MKYRRAFIPGGSFFFTLVTEQRRPLLASAEAVDILRMAFRVVRSAHPFELDAMVVLPDPLSPTSPMVPPSGIVKLTWSTAVTGLLPRLEGKTTERLLTFNRSRLIMNITKIIVDIIEDDFKIRQ